MLRNEPDFHCWIICASWSWLTTIHNTVELISEGDIKNKSMIYSISANSLNQLNHRYVATVLVPTRFALIGLNSPNSDSNQLCCVPLVVASHSQRHKRVTDRSLDPPPSTERSWQSVLGLVLERSKWMRSLPKQVLHPEKRFRTTYALRKTRTGRGLLSHAAADARTGVALMGAHDARISFRFI